MTESHVTTSPDPLGSDPLPARLLQAKNVAGIVGLIGIALLGLGLLIPSQHLSVARGLMFGYWFWLSVSLGGMAFTMISHLTGGGWGVVMRRFGEAAALNIPVLLVFSLLLGFGYYYLFPWANIEWYRDDPEVHRILLHRQGWYNSGAVFVRQLIYFLIWGIWIVALRTGSLRLDRGDNPALRRRLRMWAAGGMIMFFVTTTSLGMDFILSRETVWFSSMNGFIVAIGMGLSGMSFVCLSVGFFSRYRPLKSVLLPQHLNDLGNILLALTILWMYTSFAQFLIMWNGNLKGDIPYYVHRGLGYHANGWLFVAVWLFLGHFLAPFFLLLMKGLKRKTKTLCLIAGWLFLMRFVENQWLLAPSDPDRHMADPGHVFWTDFAAFIGIGGVWVYNYIRILGTQPLLIRNAADQPEVIVHGAHAQHAHAN